MNIVLLGDTIFDNAPYVGENEAVSELLQYKLPKACRTASLVPKS